MSRPTNIVLTRIADRRAAAEAKRGVSKAAVEPVRPLRTTMARWILSPLRTVQGLIKLAEPWGILVAVIALLISIPPLIYELEDRDRFRAAQAWEILEKPTSTSGLGKKHAIEFLVRKRAPALCHDSVEWLAGTLASLPDRRCLIPAKPSEPLNGLNLVDAKLSALEGQGARLSGSDFRRADLSRANLRDARLVHSRFGEAFMPRSDLSRANLSNSDLSHAELSFSDFSQSILQGAILFRAVMRSVNLENATLFQASLIGANLISSNLTGADLTDADLTGVVVKNANLTGADLTGANLTGADLTRANLTGAVLTRANLTGADLTGANFAEAVLNCADLTGALSTGPDLTLDQMSQIAGFFAAC